MEIIEADYAFDPQTIDAMSQALEQVCQALDLGSDRRAREVVAIRLLELARRGHRDSAAMRDQLLREASGGLD